MQFEVPQNIDLEDKILGPMTLRSFLILLFGALIVYSIFFIPGISKTVAIIIAIPLAIAVLLITFVKVQDQPFTQFFMNLIYFSLRPQKRIWNSEDIKPGVTIKNQTQKEEGHHAQKVVSHGQIEKLAQIVDTKGWKQNLSETVNGEEINLQNRVTSSNQTPLPQSKLETNKPDDVLIVPKI